MDQNQQPPSGHGGNFNITIGGSFSGENTAMGHAAQAIQTKTLYQNGQPTIDLETLKSSLVELYGHLQSAGLPPDAQMEAQAAAYQSKKILEDKEPQSEALATNIKKIGDSLKDANVTLERGSQLAGTVVKMAAILGPVVVGGAKVVASWFGVPLP